MATASRVASETSSSSAGSSPEMSVQQQQQDVTGRGGSENSGSMSDDERGSRARQTSGDLQAGSGPLDDAASRKSKLTRIHQACVNCGLKKQKCTGEQPCQPCRSANLECEYKQAKKRCVPAIGFPAPLEAAIGRRIGLGIAMLTAPPSFFTLSADPISDFPTISLHVLQHCSRESQ